MAWRADSRREKGVARLKPLGWKGVETPSLFYAAGPGRKTAGLRTRLRR